MVQFTGISWPALKFIFFIYLILTAKYNFKLQSSLSDRGDIQLESFEKN
jgi:hypothetical protein